MVKMPDPPYTNMPKKISKYFARILETGVPDKVDTPWLKSIGFGGGNDYYVVGIWKYIGFLDASSVPTDLWRRYRNPMESRAVLAQAIRNGYSDLFQTYPDANRKDREAIYAFFSSKTGKAESTINRMVSTFHNLRDLADFEIVKEEPTPVPEPTPPAEEPQISRPGERRRGISEIHINIQLVLPETKDPSIYDSIFESLKRHLLLDEE